MPSDPGELPTDPERLPDPAALAQGHRLHRLASSLEFVALLLGLLALGVGGLVTLLDGNVLEAGLWAMAFGAVVWLVCARRELPRSAASSRASAAARDALLPAKVRHLLTLVDGLIDALERSDDRGFNIESIELMLALDGLGPDASYIDERGGDRARLRHGIACFDLDAEPSARIGADHRRALHLELSRFAAAARGRTCGDPYRTGVGVGPAVLAAMREPALAKARRRYAGLLILVAATWAGVSQTLSTTGLSGRWRGWGRTGGDVYFGKLCNPWGDNPRCGLIPTAWTELLERWPEWVASWREWIANVEPSLLARESDPGALVAMAVALLPMLLLVVASLSREAGRQSWASALPSTGTWPAVARRTRLARARRWVQVRAAIRGALVWSLGLQVVAVLLGAYDWHWTWRAAHIPQQIALVMLISLGLIAIAMAARQVERWRLGKSRASRSAVVAELSSLRWEFEGSESTRPELLEQLADVLTEAPQLGRLSTQERDGVVERLRCAAARGKALAWPQRESVVLDLLGCERLIGRARLSGPQVQGGVVGIDHACGTSISSSSMRSSSS